MTGSAEDDAVAVVSTLTITATAEAAHPTEMTEAERAHLASPAGSKEQP